MCCARPRWRCARYNDACVDYGARYIESTLAIRGHADVALPSGTVLFCRGFYNEVARIWPWIKKAERCLADG